MNNQEYLLQFLQTDGTRIGNDIQDLGDAIITEIKRNPERTVALRRLVEAKEAISHARKFE